MKHAALLGLYATPLAVLVWFVARYSVNVPVHDQWRLVPLFGKIADGHAGFADFWALHSNHRIVFPKIILSLLAFASDWNIGCELALSVVFATVTFLLLFRLSSNDGRAPRDLLFHGTNILGACFVFHLVQQENWLWGFQLAWFLVNACVVTAIVALRMRCTTHAPPLKEAVPGRGVDARATERPAAPWMDSRFAVAAICCGVASFSSAQGLLSWPALVPSVIACDGKSSRPSRRLALWALLFAWMVALYSIDYHPKRTAVLASFWEKPTVAAAYFLNVLGSPLIRSPLFSSLFGLGLLSLFVILFVRAARRWGNDHAPAPWLSLGLFSVLSAAMITAGRAHYGALHALESPRYTTIAILLIIAILQLALLAGDRDRSGRRFTPGILLHRLGAVVLVGSLVAQSYDAIARANAALVYRSSAKESLELIHYLRGVFFDESPDSSLWTMTHKTALVRDGAETLDRIGFRKLAGDVPFVDAPDTVAGRIDTPPATTAPTRVRGSDRLRAAGWVAVPQGRTPPPMVLLSLGNERSFFANAFVNADEPGPPGVSDSDRARRRLWSVDVSARCLPAGETAVHAWVYDPTVPRFLKLEGDAFVTVESH